MAQKTTLSPSATPGRIYSFTAKAETVITFVTIAATVYGPNPSATIEGPNPDATLGGI